MTDKKDNKENSLNNIKSDYILRQIFNNIKQIKTLLIIKHNKNYLKRLEKEKKDYIEATKIIIELIPGRVYERKRICNMIENTYNTKYYHIILDDDEDEYDKNYFNRDDDVEKITIKIDSEVKSLSRLFSCCDYIKIINIIQFNRKDIKDISYMFNMCTSLEEINFGDFNTDNVTDMSFMFYKCYSLKKINLNKFNTKKVTNMKDMFYYCKSLSQLNLENFYTNNVTNMSYMFAFCNSLFKLNIINFDISKVIDLSYMFYKCKSLRDFYCNNFKIGCLTKKKSMAIDCNDELINKIKL